MDTASQTPTKAAALLAAEIGEFITVAEAAKLLRVADTTIYGLVADGAFGKVGRVGRTIRIPVAGFRAYMTTFMAAA
jgi:excisionase family DNA binding protein